MAKGTLIARRTHYLGIALCLLPAVTHASGLEVPDNGAVSMGRGGAFVARASDPTALIHNPAGLAGLPGLQVILGSNFGSFNHCFQRSGDYTSNASANIDTTGTVFSSSHYDTGHTAYPQVCNMPAISVVPHLIVSYQINRYVTVALGAYGPNSTGANQNFADTVHTSAGLAPSPAINMLYQKSLFLAHISIGAAFAPVHWLRIGAIVQPSYANFNFGTMSNALPSFAQSPDSDIHLGLQASGMFLAGNLGVQVLPSPYVSFGAAAHLNSTAILTGTGTTVANYFASDATQRITSSFAINRMIVPLPSTFQVGVRFALPLPGHPRQSDPHPTRAYDPMQDDRFDFEVAFVTENTSRLSTVNVLASGSIRVSGFSIPAPSSVVLNSYLNNTYGVRAGGDWNVLPGRLALRAGFSFDTGSETQANAQLQLPGYNSTGVHLGASGRFGPLTASVGYEHIFMSGIDASNADHTVISTGGALTAANCASGAGANACAVDRGVYTASLDMVSASLAGRF